MEYITQIAAILVSLLIGLAGAYPGIKALKVQKETQRAQLEAEEEERQAKVDKLKDEITERVLARANDEIQALTTKLDETIKEVDDLKKENVALRLQNGQLRLEIKKLKEYNNDKP